MKPSFKQGLGFFHLGLLRGASLLVPGRLRAEWRREWSSELWHVRHSCAAIEGVSWRAEREVTSFCLGAFQDAFCLRRQSSRADRSLTAPQGSASHCMLVLLAMLAASYTMTLLLPGVRAEHFLSRNQADPGLVMIQDANNRKAGPTISSRQFRAWAGHRQKYFDGLAFYRITPEAVSTAPHIQTGWEVAGASSNLFALLGLPARQEALADRATGDLPNVILSDDVWKRDFGENPKVAGIIVSVGSRKARIVGVAPAGSWRLPGRVDAWLRARFRARRQRRGIRCSAPDSLGQGRDVDHACSYHSVQGGRLRRRSVGCFPRSRCAITVHRISVRDHAGPAGTAGDHIRLARREQREFSPNIVAEATLPLGFPDRQDRAAYSDRLFCIHRPGLLERGAYSVFIGVHPVGRFLFDLPVWPSLGVERSAEKVPGMFEAGGTPGTSGAGLEDFPGLERNGTDVHGRPYLVARSRAPDQLVQHAALALSRHIVGISVYGSGRSNKK